MAAREDMLLRFIYATLVMKKRWTTRHRQPTAAVASAEQTRATPVSHPSEKASAEEPGDCEAPVEVSIELLVPALSQVIEAFVSRPGYGMLPMMERVTAALRQVVGEWGLSEELVAALVAVVNGIGPGQEPVSVAVEETLVMLCFDDPQNGVPSSLCNTVLECMVGELVKWAKSDLQGAQVLTARWVAGAVFSVVHKLVGSEMSECDPDMVASLVVQCIESQELKAV
ncbi:hypothetical protein ATCC90586_001028 [Pythium insidiosum]|nr:hypothetical protein ATCC90586_001028 [Pythium insidiosum]